MDRNLLVRTKKHLEAQFYVISDVWLQDCIEYYITERQNEQPSHKEVLEFVKAQLQLSDLRDVHNGTGSLPKDLATQKLVVLNGTYLLQVDQMYDIAISKYKQLQTIKNENTTNIEVTEEDEGFTSHTNKGKPATRKRMIQLKLTDGVQNVIGIEHQRIPFFDDILLPGYKVLIKGPVKCRNGVIMLKANNVIGIGGEVEHLLIPNALENVLARALNLPENADPYNDNDIKKKDKQLKEQKSVEQLLDGDFELYINEIDFLEKSHTAQTNSLQTVGQNNSLTSRQTIFNKTAVTNTTTTTTSCDSNKLTTIILDDDDDIFQSVDDQLLTNQACTSTKSSATARKERVLGGPYRCEPKSSIDCDDDDIKILDEEYSTFVTGPVTQEYQSSFVQKPMRKESSSRSNSPKMRKSKQELSGASNGSTKRPAPAELPTTVAPKKGKVNRTLDGYCQSTDIVGPPPKLCDFLCDILRESIDKTVNKIVRGHITYMGKLSRQDSAWIMDCTISDGTGALDVSFSNAVLENVLGFDVKEFSRKKKLKKENPDIEHELRMALRTAEQSFRDLDTLLELELSKNKKAVVTKIINITKQQRDAIDERMKYLIEKH